MGDPQFLSYINISICDPRNFTDWLKCLVAIFSDDFIQKLPKRYDKYPDLHGECVEK